jgi:hypothetical protein
LLLQAVAVELGLLQVVRVVIVQELPYQLLRQQQ